MKRMKRRLTIFNGENIYITTKLINILTTILLAHDNLIIGVYEIHPKYYVTLPINFMAMN